MPFARMFHFFHFIFKIYVDISLREWTRKCPNIGLKLNDNKYIHHLLFADDQVILAEDTEHTTYIFCKLMDTYTERGLKINAYQTELLTTSLNVH